MTNDEFLGTVRIMLDPLGKEFLYILTEELEEEFKKHLIKDNVDRCMIYLDVFGKLHKKYFKINGL